MPCIANKAIMPIRIIGYPVVSANGISTKRRFGENQFDGSAFVLVFEYLCIFISSM